MEKYKHVSYAWSDIIFLCIFYEIVVCPLEIQIKEAGSLQS